MMVDLYRSFAEPLSDEMLSSWHRMLFKDPGRLIDVGRYRTGEDAMECLRPPASAEGAVRSTAGGRIRRKKWRGSSPGSIARHPGVVIHSRQAKGLLCCTGSGEQKQ
jgi:hypothetical protein